MKGKKYKQSQHFIHTIYEKAFGLRQPYQVLVDAKFVREAMRHKLYLKEILPTILGGQVKIMVTPCTIEELAKLDSIDRKSSDDKVPITGSALMAKRFEVLRKCHDPNCKVETELDCIKSTVGTDNEYHFLLAAQDFDLRKYLRSVPSVPLLFINRALILMEKPSLAAKQIAEAKEKQKLGLASFEAAALSRLASSYQSDDLPAKIVRKKRKGSKQPNPLSIKKKKAKSADPKASDASQPKQEAGSKRKRRKRKACQSAL